MENLEGILINALVNALSTKGALTNEKNWMAVPQFGGWDGKTGSETNYSVVFSQARGNRKKHKDNYYRHSIGNERELLTRRHDDYRCEKKKKNVMLSFLSCIRP